MENQKTSTLKMFKSFLPYYRPYLGIVAIDLLCAALTTVCELVLPLIIKHITKALKFSFNALLFWGKLCFFVRKSLQTQQNLNDTLCGMTIPKGRYSSLFPLACKEFIQGGFNGLRLGANEHIGTYSTSLRALGIIAQGDTRYSHNGSLLGDATRVSNYGFGTFY